MTPVGFLVTAVLVGVVLFLPRRWAPVGVMASVCYITEAQQVVLAGFNFSAVRLVLLAGFARTYLLGEFSRFQCNNIDRSVFGYAVGVAAVYTVRIGTTEALVYQIGCVYNIVLSYIVFRLLLRNATDFIVFIGDLACLLVPFAALMMIESLTHWNAFGISLGESYIRAGRMRCNGSFQGPITAGIFGGTLVPLFVGLWWMNIKRPLAVVGMVSGVIIVYASNSSAPLMAVLCSIVAFTTWPLRESMRIVRRLIVVSLCCLHLLMEAPVWYLLAKLSTVTGGDGWHRSYLIDRAIHFFPSWWLLGTDDTGDWMPTAITFDNGRRAADITNQYISAGVKGGLLGVILFVAILVFCFRHLGSALLRARMRGIGEEKLLWSLGAALFAHLVTIFSVNYFDQMRVPWWGLVAMIASLSPNDDSVQEKRCDIDAEDSFVRNPRGI